MRHRDAVCFRLCGFLKTVQHAPQSRAVNARDLDRIVGRTRRQRGFDNRACDKPRRGIDLLAGCFRPHDLHDPAVNRFKEVPIVHLAPSLQTHDDRPVDQDQPAQSRFARSLQISVGVHRDGFGRARTLVGCKPRIELSGQFGLRAIEHHLEDRLLGREVMINAALRDAGGGGDVIDAHGLEPAAHEELSGRAQDSIDCRC